MAFEQCYTLNLRNLSLLVFEDTHYLGPKSHLLAILIECLLYLGRFWKEAIGRRDIIMGQKGRGMTHLPGWIRLGRWCFAACLNVPNCVSEERFLHSIQPIHKKIHSPIQFNLSTNRCEIVFYFRFTFYLFWHSQFIKNCH